METKKYYYDDSFQRKMEAIVLSCTEERGRYEIVLSGTVFFPEGGGQSADTGILYADGEQAVILDVHEREGIIYHRSDRPLAPGTGVLGVINWRERFSRMQNHSGEHLVSGMIHSLYGYNNVGFHLGKEDVTIDFDGPLTREQLNQVERLANEAVYENLPILAEFPEQERLRTMNYRSKIEIQGAVRIVTIPGYDVCACCAPHVKRTGEIGAVKFLDAVNYKGGIRVHMLCGRRAMADYEKRYEAAAKISALLSAKQEKLPEAVARMKDEVRALKETIHSLNQALIGEKLQTVTEGTAPLCFFETELKGDDLRKLVDGAASRREGICCGFFGTDEEGYQFVMAGRNADMRKESKDFLTAVGGKGGGTKEMAQGRVTGTKAAITAYFERR